MTLPELLEPIVRRRRLLIATLVLAVGASLFFSLRQEAVYQASASITVSDENSALGVAGVVTPSARTPTQIALTAAQSVRTRSVVTRASAALRSNVDGRALVDSISTSVSPESNLIAVTAEASSSREAQRRANAFARAAVDVYNDTARADYTAQAEALRRRRPPRVNGEERSQYNLQISRLRALATISAPASVSETASRPGGPSSPKPVRNGVFAAFLGLVLGLVLVFLRDSFDRRLHTSGEIETIFGFPVVGHVRDDALARRSRQGDVEMDGVDWEQFRIVRQNIGSLRPDDPPRTIAVTSGMPEEGKTTVSLNIALANAVAGRRTLLVECDLRRPSLASRLSAIRATPGVTDFVSGGAEPAEILQALDLGSTSVDPSLSTGALVVMAAGSPTTQPAEVLASETFRQMLAEVRDVYDFVVIDTAPMLPVVDAREIVPLVDAVIVCARAQRLTRDQARAAAAAIDAAAHDVVCGLVVTGTSSADERGYGVYGYMGVDA